MPGTIAVPEPEAFPREVRDYIRRLQRELDAATRRGDLLCASDLRLSLEVQTILWLTPDVSRCEICGREFRYRRVEIESRKRRGLPMPRFCSVQCNNTRLARDNRQKVRA